MQVNVFFSYLENVMTEQFYANSVTSSQRTVIPMTLGPPLRKAENRTIHTEKYNKT